MHAEVAGCAESTGIVTLGRSSFEESFVASVAQELQCSFSLHACNTPHEQATNSQFLRHNLASHTAWLEPPVQQLSFWIKHYLRCKALSPFNTSALFVLPHWVKTERFASGWRLVKTIPKGTLLAANVPAPYTLHLWYDEPIKPKLRAIAPKDALLFPCKIGRHTLTALLDTGASHTIVSSHILDGAAIQPCPALTVEVAGGKHEPLRGQAQVPVTIQKYMGIIPALVMDKVLPNVDLILGMDWLDASAAKIDIPGRKCLITTTTPQGRTKEYEILAQTTASNPSGEVADCGVAAMHTVCATLSASQPNLMSPSAARRLMKKHDARCCLVVVRDKTAIAPFLGAIQNPTEGTNTNVPGLVPQAQITSILDEYKDVFETITGAPPDRGISHTIELEEGARPVFQRMYRLSPAELQEVERQVKELLAKGLIQPSTSPWGSPILFAAKKDGTLRMCVDYRQLNKMTVKNRYPLPNPADLFDALQGAQVFSSIDLQSGYHQILLNPEDQGKTAFRTPSGHWEFRVLPFGIANAPATFQSVMNRVLSPHIGKFCLCYLDDIIIFSKTPAEHEEHLRAILALLRKEQLRAKLSKCEFNKPELSFLGMVVGRQGLKVDQRKIAVVRDWATPTEVSALRGFLGLANYFRKFIQGYSSLVAPLTQLTGSVEWSWGPEQQEAFDGVKHALTNAPVLALPDMHKPFEVVSDASLRGTGAVLMQEGRPIAYTSAKFTPAERGYTTTEQELLGVIKALKEWRCYLEGPQITLVTDHNPNTFLDTQKSLHKISRRQVRWLEFLARFHYSWQYRPGRVNVADPLSRMHTLVVHALSIQRVAFQSDLPQLILQGYENEPWLKDPSNLQAKGITCDADGYYRRNGRIVVPGQYDLRNRILTELHDSPYAGHRGAQRTHELISREFWWPGITADVTRYVHSCTACQKNKSSNQRPAGLLQPLPIPEQVWDCVTMDFVTALPKTAAGYDAILVFVDRLSKMVHIAPTTEEVDTSGLAQLFVDHVIKHHGFPKEVLSDRGSTFVSTMWTEVMRITGTQQKLSSAYHPETDGQTERANRVIQEILRNYVNPTSNDWDTKLSMVEFAMNNAYNASTQSTPFQLNSCRQPRLPPLLGLSSKVPAATDFCTALSEQIERAKRFIAQAQERYKHYADLSRRPNDDYKVGQKVLLNTKNLRFKHPAAAKFVPKFLGPLTIAALVGDHAVRLQLPPQWRIHDVFHVSLIKPYDASRDKSAAPAGPIAFLDGVPNFSIERILAHRDVKRGGRTEREYLVSWSQSGPDANSWEPAKDLPDVLVDLYLMTSPAAKRAAPAANEEVDDDLACEVCNRTTDAPSMLVCDECNKGWHKQCLNPPLARRPRGHWFCPKCTQPQAPGRQSKRRRT